MEGLFVGGEHHTYCCARCPVPYPPPCCTPPTHTHTHPPAGGIDPDAEEKKRREEEEAVRAAARAHGHPVTVEDFMAWKAKYDAGGCAESDTAKAKQAEQSEACVLSGIGSGSYLTKHRHNTA